MRLRLGGKARRGRPIGRVFRLVLLMVGLAVFAIPLGATQPQEFVRGTWPFCPPVRPAVPEVRDAGWIANPIDAFVLARLEAAGLTPSEPADRLTLLRRVSFDLTGLPPTAQEQAAFLADEAPGAYERLVDRLLDSPRYGERWAQHWLDLVRYAETDGFNADGFRPAAHRYRDYVIRAFNDDLPYDRFIRQQLAGDELEPGNSEALIATGFNRLYPDEYNAANVVLRRQEIHDNLTDTAGLVFLGLTMGCAQCHDHKFDPITQVDYFRLQAFFATLLPKDDAPTVSPDELQEHARRQAEWEAATRDIRAEIDALLSDRRQAVMSGALEKFEPEIRLAVETSESERTCLQKQIAFQVMRYVAPKMEGLGSGLKGDAKARFAALQKQLAEFDHLKPAELPVAMIACDGSSEAPPTYRLEQGDYRKPAEQVQPGFPAFLGASEPDIVTPPAGPQSSGRRAALAEWLCREDHPLTARVMVNRLWTHHFGAGIVATPNDFGAMGEPPTHADLLDWLAVELVEQQWSLKAMHRLMVTSATYRQSSQVDSRRPEQARALQVDGGNRLLWHARRQRLSGEAVRDAVLLISGDLSGRMFGRSARPELPAGVAGKSSWQVDKAEVDRNRRSVYIFAKRNLRFPLFDIFDLPDLHNSCPVRTVTTTAPQALALLNGEFAVEQARRWSAGLQHTYGDDARALVNTVWRSAFARTPAEDEVIHAQMFLAEQTSALAGEGHSTEEARAMALADFCHAIFNSNEFIYVD